jgi:hypothetical protein
MTDVARPLHELLADTQRHLFDRPFRSRRGTGEFLEIAINQINLLVGQMGERRHALAAIVNSTSQIGPALGCLLTHRRIVFRLPGLLHLLAHQLQR